MISTLAARARTGAQMALGIACVLGFCMSLTPGASAETPYNEKAVADFYQGKTIEIVVGFTPGASFDLTARALARHMGRYIPGNPTIIVDNVPGAGSMLAMTRVYNTMPKDGTVIASVLGGIVKNQLFNDPAAHFDINKMHLLSAPAEIAHMLVVTKASGVTSLSEIMGPNAPKKIKIGATGKGTSVANSAYLAKLVAGLNYDIVAGYGGFAKIKLAMEQGEVNATFNNINELLGLYKDEIDSGEWKIIAQSTDKPNPRAPNVPVLADMAKTPEMRKLYVLGAVLPMKFAFMYALAPGVPEDRVKALEQAMDRTLADKEFVADMVKTGLVVNPIPAAEMRDMVSEFMHMPDDIKAKLAPVIK